MYVLPHVQKRVALEFSGAWIVFSEVPMPGFVHEESLLSLFFLSLSLFPLSRLTYSLSNKRKHVLSQTHSHHYKRQNLLPDFDNILPNRIFSAETSGGVRREVR